MTDVRARNHQSTNGERPLAIALVNNMPDTAFLATERQFARLANEASSSVRMKLYRLPSIARGLMVKEEVGRYHPVDELYLHGADALIVTGTEPRTPDLKDENYWPELVGLIDWAVATRVPSLWSCLAAHAAVLHLDGIERRRLPAKLSGVYHCATTLHGAAMNLPLGLSVTHSRLNEIPREELLRNGYDIVSEAPGGIVDAFVRDFGAYFLFFQGHPEYDPDSLFREFRRDAGRYLNGERSEFPALPENYFDDDTVCRMEAFAAQAEAGASNVAIQNFPEATLRAGLAAVLKLSSTTIFAGWLALLAQRVQPSAR